MINKKTLLKYRKTALLQKNNIGTDILAFQHDKIVQDLINIILVLTQELIDQQLIKDKTNAFNG